MIKKNSIDEINKGLLDDYNIIKKDAKKDFNKKVKVIGFAVCLSVGTIIGGIQLYNYVKYLPVQLELGDGSKVSFELTEKTAKETKGILHTTSRKMTVKEIAKELGVSPYALSKDLGYGIDETYDEGTPLMIDMINIKKIEKTIAEKNKKTNLQGVSHTPTKDGLVISKTEKTHSEYISELPNNFKSYFKTFKSPLNLTQIVSYFSDRFHPIYKKTIFHKGVDLKASVGTKVYADQNGKVIFVGEETGYGKLIIIEHEYGILSYFGHLNKYRVKKGDTVSQGQEIGLSGKTGNVTGPHLHYEIRFNVEHKMILLNPIDFIPEMEKLDDPANISQLNMDNNEKIAKTFNIILKKTKSNNDIAITNKNNQIIGKLDIENKTYTILKNVENILDNSETAEDTYNKNSNNEPNLKKNTKQNNTKIAGILDQRVNHNRG